MTDPAPSKAKVACILAGGGSRRMGGVDKGALTVGGKRLVDHVWERLKTQAEEIIISGPTDYGLGLNNVRDRDNGLEGPAAGLCSIAHWIMENRPEVNRFLAAPVDGPLLPLDLYRRLAGGQGSAVARVDDRLHATFALWRVDRLLEVMPRLAEDGRFSLHAVAEAAGAKPVDFDDAGAFFNVNHLSDIDSAANTLKLKR